MPPHRDDDSVAALLGEVAREVAVAERLAVPLKYWPVRHLAALPQVPHLCRRELPVVRDEVDVIPVRPVQPLNGRDVVKPALASIALHAPQEGPQRLAHVGKALRQMLVVELQNVVRGVLAHERDHQLEPFGGVAVEHRAPLRIEVGLGAPVLVGVGGRIARRQRPAVFLDQIPRALAHAVEPLSHTHFRPFRRPRRSCRPQ